MTGPTKLILIRHARTERSGDTLLGRLPGIPLSLAGRREARGIGATTGEVHHVITSPQVRAIQTAELAFRGMRHEIDESFDELDFGEWSGLLFAELDGSEDWKAFNRDRVHVSAPGGESLSDVRRRVCLGVDNVIHKYEGKTIAVVTHGDVIRTAIAVFAGAPLSSFDRFQIDMASCTTVEVFPWGRVLLRSVNA